MGTALYKTFVVGLNVQVIPNIWALQHIIGQSGKIIITGEYQMLPVKKLFSLLFVILESLE